jgi:hypothetical protein
MYRVGAGELYLGGGGERAENLDERRVSFLTVKWSRRN